MVVRTARLAVRNKEGVICKSKLVAKHTAYGEEHGALNCVQHAHSPKLRLRWE